MQLDLNTIGGILAIISFFCGAFNYVVIRPLNKSIQDLKDSVSALAKTAQAFEREKDEIDKRVVKLEERTDQHERHLDLIDERIGKGAF